MTQTPEERIALLEERVKLLADVVSRQAGEFQALQAAFHGALMFAGDIGAVQNQINLQLEKCTASNLAQSMNSAFFEAFENEVNLIRLAMETMQEHRRGNQSPPSGTG